VKREQLLAQVKVLQGQVDRACTEEAEVQCSIGCVVCSFECEVWPAVVL
jgi:hypothetical protein